MLEKQNNKVANFIENGIEWLETHEWVQNTMFSRNKQGKVVGGCLLTALQQGNKLERHLGEFIMRAMSALKLDLPDDKIIHFNDKVATSKEDVIDQMTITVKRLRNSG